MSPQYPRPGRNDGGFGLSVPRGRNTGGRRDGGSVKEFSQNGLQALA